ncbi:MAG TPA: site-2 protease family protein [Polyangiaceae bacterium]|jgi:Zn-dependent protease|nr:site-2 protease family protein [Polyangiaceae bacterium]
MAGLINVEDERHGRARMRLVLIAVRAVATFVGGFGAVLAAGWLSYHAGRRPHAFSPGMALGAFVVGSLLGSASVARAFDRTEPAPPATPELRNAALSLLEQPAATNQKTKFGPLLAISLLAFLATGGSTHGVQGLLILTAVLAFHEGGHLVAMRALGYRDTRILFIPFLGAVTTGTREDVSGTERALVLLAGPLPGLLLGLALIFSGSSGDPLLRQVAGMLIAINAFNLLPLGALDGGKLFDVLLFSRSPWLQTAFTLLSSACLGLLALLLHSWLLVALALFSMLTASSQHAVAVAARAIAADPRFSPDLRAASPEFLDALFTVAYDAVPSRAKRPKNVDLLPRLCANAMRMIHASAKQRPASPSLALIVLSGYAALFGLAALAWLHRA